MWEVRAGRARDIGVLDLGLGLEAGLEPELLSLFGVCTLLESKILKIIYIVPLRGVVP